MHAHVLKTFKISKILKILRKKLSQKISSKSGLGRTSMRNQNMRCTRHACHSFNQFYIHQGIEILEILRKNFRRKVFHTHILTCESDELKIFLCPLNISDGSEQKTLENYINRRWIIHSSTLCSSRGGVWGCSRQGKGLSSSEGTGSKSTIRAGGGGGGGGGGGNCTAISAL